MTVCPSGVLFNKDKRGFLPKLMQSMYDDRTTYKKLMLKTKQDKIDGKGDPVELDKKIAQLNNKQMAAKILLNSAYGALGNQYFRYFDIRQAESITLSGQLSIRWIEEKVNIYMNKILKNDEDKNYVIASDTDSIYVALGDLVDKFVKIKEGESKSEETRRKVDFLDKVAQEKFEPYIDKCYQDLATYVNAYDQKMQMAREVIADSGIWTAKKRYILNVWDNEGVRYKSPELKIMGLEAVRSSTPESCRNMIKKSLELILRSNNDSLIEFIEQFRQDFKTYEVDDVAFPRSVNGLTKYHDPVLTYKKGTPIHVKGVLFYNQLVKKHKLEMQYPPIKDGEKIKFCYLKEPNPLQNNTIAIAAGTLPKEFELDKFLDYDTQFEKAYLEPIKTIAETIGWEIEKKITLDSFFN
jgi:DNA polymerase elongation subunit (family B)